DLDAGRPAGADLDLLADTLHDRPSADSSDRHADAHAVVGGRHVRSPARPDDRVPALERKRDRAGIGRGLRIIGGVLLNARIVQAAEHRLVAAVGHLVEQLARSLRRIGRAQDEHLRLVFDHAARIYRCGDEIDDDLVAGIVRIKLALGDALDPYIGPGRAEALAVRE